MLFCYVEKDFRPATLDIIDQANGIIDEYQRLGFSLTLRQLYYQFVSRELLVNKQSEYNRLGSIINDARLAGLIDWTAIEDRTRNLQAVSTWDNPTDILNAAWMSYKTDKWKEQPYRIEVWIEKDALTGVIEPICKELEIPFFACRGYNGQSEQWRAAQRFAKYVLDDRQNVIVLHLGDHDPSGIDMTRDNEERLKMLMAGDCSWDLEVVRVALNMDQVEEYKPPPNPAKLTDSRSDDYVLEYGKKSWELDALSPPVIHSLIKHHVMNYRDQDLWDKAVEAEQADKDLMADMIKQLGEDNDQ